VRNHAIARRTLSANILASAPDTVGCACNQSSLGHDGLPR